MIDSFLTCFTHISLAFYGNLNQVLPQNLVGRLITHDRVLGRYTRFYNPDSNQLQRQILMQKFISKEPPLYLKF